MPHSPAVASLKINCSKPVIISDCILFFSLFLYTWLVVNPTCNYYYPGFWRHVPVDGYTTWFLTDTPPYPGKSSYWLISLLSSGFANALVGAAIVTVIAFILSQLSGLLLAIFGVKNGAGLKYVPAMILLFQFFYMVNSLPFAVSVIIGLTFALLYQSACRLKPPGRFILFAVFSVAVLTSAIEAFLIFSLLCVISEGFFRRNPVLAFIQASASACLPAGVTTLLFPLCTSAETYRLILPPLPASLSFIGVLPLVFWMLFPCMAAIPLVDKPLGHILNRFKLNTVPSLRHDIYRGILLSVMIAFVTGITLRLVRDPLTLARPNAIMNSAMLSRNWDLLLDEAGKIPKRYLTDSKVHIVNRALYYKGRLLDDLFRFPQSRNALLLFPYSGSIKSLSPADRFWTTVWGSWTYYELGLVNVAEHCALEATSQFYYPEGLRLLALIYIIKDMPDAGRTCLTALCKDRVYRPWAETCLAALHSDPAMSNLPEVRTIRSNSLKEKAILSDMPPLAALIKENPYNRMAFEYLIASLLIRREIDSLDRLVPGLRTLKYDKIPKLFEESLLVYAFLTGRNPDLCGYAIRSETMASFDEFRAILYSKHGGRTRDAYKELVIRFGDSYFFYYLYGFSKAKVPDEKA